MNEKLSQKFEQSLDRAAVAFLDVNPAYTLLISHNDADGLASLALLQIFLAKKAIPAQNIIFNREKSWSDLFKPLLGKGGGKAVVIIMDLGGEISEIGRLFKGRPELVIILDHHQPLWDGTPLPENVLVCNPVQFGFDGLKEVAGATVTYLFAKKVDRSTIKSAWLPAIGISGDSLMHMNEFRSYNKEVLEEAIAEGQIIKKDGACFYGATHEKIKNALAWSILPYIPQVQSNPQKAENLLRQWNIPPDKLVEYLDEAEVNRLVQAFGPSVAGSFGILPKKQGLLRYCFEHAVLLNILGFKQQNLALQAITNRIATGPMKQQYTKYNLSLSKNLTTFANLPRIEGPNSVIIDVIGILPPSEWSDTSSFASVNEIFDPKKMLFLAGKEEEKIKFSVRCSQAFIDSHNGENSNTIIQRIKKDFNATGGGHTLAGGLKINPQDYDRFKQSIEKYFQEKPLN